MGTYPFYYNICFLVLIHYFILSLSDKQELYGRDHDPTEPKPERTHEREFSDTASFENERDREFFGNRKPSESFYENDVEVVMGHARVDRAAAVAALKKHDGDVVNAIMVRGEEEGRGDTLLRFLNI